MRNVLTIAAVFAVAYVATHFLVTFSAETGMGLWLIVLILGAVGMAVTKGKQRKGGPGDDENSSSDYSEGE